MLSPAGSHCSWNLRNPLPLTDLVSLIMLAWSLQYGQDYINVLPLQHPAEIAFI